MRTDAETKPSKPRNETKKKLGKAAPFDVVLHIFVFDNDISLHRTTNEDPYWVSPSQIEFSPVFYWALPGFTGFYRVLLGFTGFYWVLTGFYWVLPGFNWFYWVLLGFTGFYWVLLGFIGF